MLVRTLRTLLVSGAALVATAPGIAQASNIVVTLRAPGQVSPHFLTDATFGQGICEQNRAPGARCTYGVEDFSTLTQSKAQNGFTTNFTTGDHHFLPGETLAGSYSGQLTRVGTDQYGGAQGTVAYPAAFGQAVYTVDYATAGVPGVNYLGVWISAMDASNELLLHTSDGGIIDFTTSTLTSYINATPNPSEYYGNPTPSFSGQDSSEPFAYVNFYNTNGFFTKAEFTNNGNSGFESSNHAAGYFNPIFIQGRQVADLNSVPEPASAALLGAGLLTLLSRKIRRRRA